MDAKITTILVTYESQATIGPALESLHPSHQQGMLDCLVVDNDSKDRTPAIAREDHAWAQLIESGDNLGYGRGCNLGLEHVTTPYVMFMNADARIEQAAIERLVEVLDQKPEIGMVAPALIGGDQLQLAGALPSPISILANAVGVTLASMKRRPIQPGEEPFQTNWLCGALLVARTDTVREMGGFDARFFLYFEETDLCRRMIKRGLELWAVGEAVAYHEGGVSAAQSDKDLRENCIKEYFNESRFIYLAIHWGHPLAALTETLEFALLAMRWLVKRVCGRNAANVISKMKRPVIRMPVSRGNKQ